MSEQRAWEVFMTPPARRQFSKLPRHVQRDVDAKILWLAQNADVIRHERLRGQKEYSLHIGQYRVLYELDWKKRRVTIVRVGAHNEAYRR